MIAAAISNGANESALQNLLHWHGKTEPALLDELEECHHLRQIGYGWLMFELGTLNESDSVDVRHFCFEANEISTFRSRNAQSEHWHRFYLILDLVCLRLVRYDPDTFWFRTESALLRRIGRRIQKIENASIRSAAWKYSKIPFCA